MESCFRRIGVKTQLVTQLNVSISDIDGSTLCVLSSSSTDDWITVKYTKVVLRCHFLFYWNLVYTS